MRGEVEGGAEADFNHEGVSFLLFAPFIKRMISRGGEVNDRCRGGRDDVNRPSSENEDESGVRLGGKSAETSLRPRETVQTVHRRGEEPGLVEGTACCLDRQQAVQRDLHELVETALDTREPLEGVAVRGPQAGEEGNDVSNVQGPVRHGQEPIDPVLEIVLAEGERVKTKQTPLLLDGLATEQLALRPFRHS